MARPRHTTGFVSWFCLAFADATGATAPILVEHFRVADPTDPGVADFDPWLRATLFVRGDQKFADYGRRREAIAFVDRYAPAHVAIRLCWVGRHFTLPTPPKSDAGPVAVATWQQQMRDLLCSVVSEVDHGLGIRIGSAPTRAVRRTASTSARSQRATRHEHPAPVREDSTMTVTNLGQYPVYTSGQTLTAEDLNDEQAYLAGRDRLLGRTVGFGIAAGLEGTVTDGGTRLEIAPGLAIDQSGEAIMLTAEQAASIGVIPLEPSVTANASFESVSGTDGYTVVLQAHVIEGPAQNTCSAQGCEGHARLDTLSSELVVVQGRLVLPGTDFSQEILLTQFAPLTFASTGTVMGAFVGLRDMILNRVGDGLSAAATARLQGLALTGSDILALQQYKAAFLNQVYVAALDLLRFRSLMSQTTLRDTTTPGVVLGWVHQSGGWWVWDCSFRHHWEPPTGLTQAYFGGSCQRPDQLYIDRLENLVMSYNPPTPPAPADPPGGFDPGNIHICTKRECLRYPYPGKQLHEDWRHILTNPGGPIEWVDPLHDPDPEQINVDIFDDVYGDLTQSGHIELSTSFGAAANQVKTALDQTITAAGIAPQTTVVALAQAQATPGLTYASGISPDDTALLVQDDQGKLVGVGRVAAALSLQQVGTGLPAARQQAQAAMEATTGFGEALTGLSTTVGQLNLGLTQVQQTQVELSVVQQTFQQNVELLPTQVETQVNQLVSTYQADTVNHVDGVVQEKMSDFQQRLDTAYDATVKLNEFQSSTNDNIKQLYTQLSRGVVGKGVVSSEIGTNTVQVLRGVRDALANTGDADTQTKISPQLAAVDDGLNRMEAVIAAGGNGLEENPATLTSVLSSLADGLSGVGANASQVRAVRTRVNALGKLLQS